jgi:hypothetical protein
VGILAYRRVVADADEDLDLAGVLRIEREGLDFADPNAVETDTQAVVSPPPSLNTIA